MLRRHSLRIENKLFSVAIATDC